MQWLNDNAPALEQHLSALAVAARQMLATLTREYEQLHARNIPAPELLREKAHWASDLESRQLQFQAFRSTLPAEDLGAALAQLPATADNEHIKNQWHGTIDLLQACDRQNAVNGQMLHRLHVRNQIFARLLSNQATDPTYSRQGQLAEGRQGTLGHA